jgi:hypothetical protein
LIPLELLDEVTEGYVALDFDAGGFAAADRTVRLLL